MSAGDAITRSQHLRRVEYLQKAVLRILSRKRPKGKPSSQKRLQRFAKYDSLISRCVEDTKALQHFVDAQRVAFQKILKKYRVGHAEILLRLRLIGAL